MTSFLPVFGAGLDRIPDKATTPGRHSTAPGVVRSSSRCEADGYQLPAATDGGSTAAGSSGSAADQSVMASHASATAETTTPAMKT